MTDVSSNESNNKVYNESNNNNKNKLQAYLISKKKACVRQKEFRLRKKQKGLTELNIWVPLDSYVSLYQMQFPTTENKEILDNYSFKLAQIIKILNEPVEKKEDESVEKNEEKSIEEAVSDSYVGNFAHRVKVFENLEGKFAGETVMIQKAFFKKLKDDFDLILTKDDCNSKSNKQLGEFLYRMGYYTYNKLRKKSVPSPKLIKSILRYLYSG